MDKTDITLLDELLEDELDGGHRHYCDECDRAWKCPGFTIGLHCYTLFEKNCLDCN